MLSMSYGKFRISLAQSALCFMSLSVVPCDAVMEGLQYSLLVTYATIQCDDSGHCFLYIDLTTSNHQI